MRIADMLPAVRVTTQCQFECGMASGQSEGWLLGRAPSLPALVGPPLMQFELKNCHVQLACKIIEVGGQNDRWIVYCGQKLVIFEASK